MLNILKAIMSNRNKKILICGIMFFLIQLTIAKTASAKQPHYCDQAINIAAATQVFSDDDYAGAVATVLKAEGETHHQGRALLCFFNFISRMNLEARTYRLLGIALYDAAIDKTSPLEASLAVKYLAVSETAFRRVLGAGVGGVNLTPIRLALARNLLEQVHTYGKEILKEETKHLLNSYIKRDPVSTQSNWARDALRELESLSSDEERDRSLEKSVHSGENVIPPVRIKFKHPGYTKEARFAGVQGTVVMQSVIDRNGSVVYVKILKGLPFGLSENALEALEKSKFKPATLHGEPVAVHYNFSMNFTL